MQIELGSSGIVTSALVLGCARLGSTLTPLTRKQSVDLIAEAFDLGIRHFDTASIYGQGDSERYLGAALRGRRDAICLSSKAGQRMSPRQALLAHFKGPIRLLAQRAAHLRKSIATQREQGIPRCFSPDYIERSLFDSLRRTRSDHLDIFYLHSPDACVLNDEALFDRISRLQRAGHFRAFGVSCDERDVAWAAARQPAVQVVQFAFDDTADSRELLAALAQQGKTALVRGLMRPVASDAHSSTPESRNGSATLASRFGAVLQLPALGGLIVGTTNAQHLRDNVAAFRQAAPGRLGTR